MDHERWLEIEGLMQEALDLPPDERAAFLDRKCGEDAELRSEVERMLALGDEDFSLIEQPVYVGAASLFTAPTATGRSNERFGRYEVGELLGSGGMGEVYLARDTQLRRNVALKLLPADYTTDRERVRRFQQEARAASALNHPNIITIYEVGEHEGCQFIATEYVEGETLRRRIARGRLGAGEALEIAAQAAGALAAAHRAGIIHRDVKPENLMLRPDGYVKVLDFGLAKLTEQADLAADLAESTPGIVMGTVRYMSPEQARAQELDARTDVFSLGVVLYEMLAGRRPFEGETASDVIAEVLKVEPEPISEMVAGAPEALDHVLGRALAKRREERYGSAGELEADLKALARDIDLRTEWTRLQTSSGAARALETSGVSAARTAEQSSATWQRVREATSTTIRTAFGSTKRGTASTVLIVGAVLAPAAFVLQHAEQRVPFQRVTISRLEAGDGVGFTSISPDGRYLVEVRRNPNGSGPGAESLWLRHRATGGEVHLVDANWLNQGLPTFSSNSNDIYYVATELDAPNGGLGQSLTVWRIPALGGEPQRIATTTWSPVGVSPDSQRIAFVRKSSDDTTTLCVANADGSGERVIASRAPPEYLSAGGPAWSPDGASVACGTTGGLVVVSVEGGDERPFGTEAFGEVDRIVWPADGGGMLVLAAEKGKSNQIWHISFPQMEPRRITNDFENYTTLSVTADATTIVSMQSGTMSNLWVAPDGDARQARQITTGRFHQFRVVRWTPDGRIVGPANTTGTRELWIMNADGSARKKLTSEMNVTWPAASPDGRYLLFTSTDPDNRMFVWRIDPDGGNPMRLAEGFGAECSPDGWVFFANDTLWKVRIEGGEPVRATEMAAGRADVSRDGKLLLCNYAAADRGAAMGIFSAETGKLVRRLDVPVTMALWSPDERGVLVKGPNGASGSWARPLDGGPPYRIAELPPGDAVAAEWSADGTLVYTIGQDYSDNVLIADQE